MPGVVGFFESRRLPQPGTVVGYGALIQRYRLQLPLPSRLAAIATTHHPQSSDDWLMLTPRHAPSDDLEGQLIFALKWEGVDLPVLAKLFEAIPADDIAAIVAPAATRSYHRRIWFLYEWLTGNSLPLPDLSSLKAIPVVDNDLQHAIANGALSRRHRVIDNLPGSPGFCPMVRRSAPLQRLQAEDYKARVAELAGRTRPDLLVRASSFLQLNDSKASFGIEGERPSNVRAARWAQAIGQAGRFTLDLTELERLQAIVLGDDRYTQRGLRDAAGFIGIHSPVSHEPIPDHISANAADLPKLVSGLLTYIHRAIRGGMDPVVVAAAASFGFVYIHPFFDGNGRLHRWLVHHVLAAAQYSPPDLVFPISAVILRQMDAYHRVLTQFSRPLMQFIAWRAAPDNNVAVLNDTAAYYRFFDATPEAIFLYECMREAVERDIPEEVAYLQAYDSFKRAVDALVDMPPTVLNLLRRFLAQNGGRLSQRARTKEFALLTDAEVTEIEAAYVAAFGTQAP